MFTRINPRKCKLKKELKIGESLGQYRKNQEKGRGELKKLKLSKNLKKQETLSQTKQLR